MLLVYHTVHADLGHVEFHLLLLVLFFAYLQNFYKIKIKNNNLNNKINKDKLKSMRKVRAKKCIRLRFKTFLSEATHRNPYYSFYRRLFIYGFKAYEQFLKKKTKEKKKKKRKKERKEENNKYSEAYY